MKLWIDADAAPQEVKDLVFRASKRLQLPVVLVANTVIRPPLGNPLVSAVVVEGRADAADKYIVDQAEPGDVAVTQDVPLAAALVEKQVVTISPRGLEFTPDTVGQRLALRNMLEETRSAGGMTGGPSPYSAKDRHTFATTLDQVLTRLLRKRNR
ncbi:YaiI/YqxD family protein [Planctellipticum variicoloris]|uniref:YaiI/YqxD family protein n=1 Tax=Planctellipticum variicoloris TaxID=3064265 RepID=UPI002B8947C2|nr:YaiI/YqxD family protein [Planctomycetaceae bacterium SH412]HTN00501.1 YaiI/YqxD family protein [Planctomycetaceae bacterium]